MESSAKTLSRPCRLLGGGIDAPKQREYRRLKVHILDSAGNLERVESKLNRLVFLPKRPRRLGQAGKPLRFARKIVGSLCQLKGAIEMVERLGRVPKRCLRHTEAA